MDELRSLFPVSVRSALLGSAWEAGLEEVRIRVGQPVEFLYGTGRAYLKKQDETLVFCKENRKTNWTQEAYKITEAEIAEMLNYISSYSLYAYQEQICQGFLTVRGGHRIGVAGVAATDHGSVTGLHHISFLNIRVAHEKKGCAKELLPYLWEKDGIYNTLFISAPGMGKTTYLRDCIRLISSGTKGKEGLKVCVVDERSEIAASHLGVPQNDLGPRTDVLDGCPKGIGIGMLLRSMSPQVLAVDELGGEEDYRRMEEAVYCGCRILGTLHAGNVEELAKKPYFSHWISQKLFGRFVQIEKREDGTRKLQIFNEAMERLC
jgi:stage III sporulation protein AA